MAGPSRPPPAQDEETTVGRPVRSTGNLSFFNVVSLATVVLKPVVD